MPSFSPIKLAIFLGSLILLYFALGAVALRHFLDDLIFLKPEAGTTTEEHRFTYEEQGNQLLVRQYGNTTNNNCIIFFPGRHGGIARYEEEIFYKLDLSNTSLFALSYPGYEGAKGSSSLQSLPSLIHKTLHKIEQENHCNKTNTVFAARSLGAAIALEVAKDWRPAKLFKTFELLPHWHR